MSSSACAARVLAYVLAAIGLAGDAFAVAGTSLLRAEADPSSAADAVSQQQADEAEKRKRSEEALKDESTAVRDLNQDAEKDLKKQKNGELKEEEEAEWDSALFLAVCCLGAALFVVFYCRSLDAYEARRRSQFMSDLHTKIDAMRARQKVLGDKAAIEEMKQAMAREAEEEQARAMERAREMQRQAEAAQAAQDAARQEELQKYTGPRKPTEGKKVRLTCAIGQATGIPDVNLLGGVDPFVELRICKKNPDNQKNAGLLQPYEVLEQTAAKNGNSPDFKEKISFLWDWNSDAYLQLIMYDSGSMSNVPIGYVSMEMGQAAKDSTYLADGEDPTVSTKHLQRFKPIAVNQSYQVNDMKLAFNVEFKEIHDLKISPELVVAAPDLIGDGEGSNVKVEVRIVKDDPFQEEFTASPPSDCIISFMTKEAKGREPKLRDKFTAPNIEANPRLYFHFLVWHSPVGMLGGSDQCIGHAALPVFAVTVAPPKPPVVHEVQLDKAPGYGEAAGALQVALAYEHSIGEAARKRTSSTPRPSAVPGQRKTAGGSRSSTLVDTRSRASTGVVRPGPSIPEAIQEDDEAAAE